MMAGLVDDAEQVMSSGVGAVRAWPVVVWLAMAAVACGEAADEADGGRAADANVLDARVVAGDAGGSDRGMDAGGSDRGVDVGDGDSGGDVEAGDAESSDSGPGDAGSGDAEALADGAVVDGMAGDGMAGDGSPSDGMMPDSGAPDEGPTLDEGPEPDMAPEPDMGPECRVAQDCAAGLVCTDGACMPCVDDMQCEGVCVEGRCAACDLADHRGCAGDALCCDAEGGGEACVPTSVASGCEACGVACDPVGADGCVERVCTCQGGAACDEALFCQPPEADLRCVACRDDADCVDPVRPRCDGATGQCALPLDLLDTLGRHPDVRTFMQFVGDAGLAAELGAQPRLTLFVPTDHAMDRVSDECLLTLQFEPEVLSNFVRQHVLLGNSRVDSARLRASAAAGDLITMQTFDAVEASLDESGAVLLDEIPVAGAVEAVNGVAHLLDDGVLLNDELMAAGCP